MNSAKKWTQCARRYVYLRVLSEFGTFESWGLATYPSGKKKEFDKLMKELSKELKNGFGINVTPEAINNQIDWGVANQSVIRNRGGVCNWILNRAAALETGMITSANLPDTVMAHI